MRSLRIRQALLYSLLLFGIATILIWGMYLVLADSVTGEPITAQVVTAQRFGPGAVIFTEQEVTFINEFERQVNERTLDRLRVISLVALVALFPTSVLVGWLVAGRVVRPLRRITDVARQIETYDLSRRIRLDGPDDELRQLAETFDGMLDRLQAGTDAQKAFLEETAHELRNPLAVVATNLDVAIVQSVSPNERLEAAHRGLKRLQSLVDAQLQFARTGQLADDLDDLDLVELVEAVARQHGPRADSSQHKLVVLASSAQVVGNGEALERAVANLLDNAFRLSPVGSSITVGCGTENDWVWLGVADEGPGVAEDLSPVIFGRHVRGNELGSGSGLGLAIVRQVAEAHNGFARLFAHNARSSFVLWLPRTIDAAVGAIPTEDPFTRS